MIPAAAGLITALAGDHDLAVAVQVGSMAVVDWPQALTLNSVTHQPAPAFVEQLAAVQDASLATLQVLVADYGSAITTAHRGATLHGSLLVLTVGIRAIGSSTWYALELFRGEVGQLVDLTEGLQARIRGTGDASTFGRLAPELFSDRCPFTTTAQCAYAQGCAKTWGACTKNLQTSRFGGFRFVRPGGTVVEFREWAIALGSSEGTASTSTTKTTVDLRT